MALPVRFGPNRCALVCNQDRQPLIELSLRVNLPVMELLHALSQVAPRETPPGPPRHTLPKVTAPLTLPPELMKGRCSPRGPDGTPAAIGNLPPASRQAVRGTHGDLVPQCGLSAEAIRVEPRPGPRTMAEESPEPTVARVRGAGSFWTGGSLVVLVNDRYPSYH